MVSGGRARRRRPRPASPPASPRFGTRGGRELPVPCVADPAHARLRPPRRGGEQLALDPGAGRLAPRNAASSPGRARPRRRESAQRSRGPRASRASARAPRWSGEPRWMYTRSSAPVATSQTSHAGFASRSRPASSATTPTPRGVVVGSGASGVESACAITIRRQRAGVSKTPITLRERPFPGPGSAGPPPAGRPSEKDRFTRAWARPSRGSRRVVARRRRAASRWSGRPRPPLRARQARPRLSAKQ